MTELDFAARVGISQNFVDGNVDFPDVVVERLNALGIRMLRTEVDAIIWRSDKAAFSACELICRLARKVEVLPALRMPSASLATLPPTLDRLLRSLPDDVPAIELTDVVISTQNSAAIAAAAERIREAGKLVVLSLARQRETDVLTLLGSCGVLESVDVIGLQPERPPLTEWLIAMHRTVHAFNPALKVWISNTGYSCADGDDTGQAHAFAAAVDLPVERVYWRGAQEVNGEAFSALYDADGQPRLAARLLEGGLNYLKRTLLNPAPAIIGTRPVLVTGGAGFIGANLTDRLASDGHEVVVYDALSRPGVERNLEWLKQRHPGKIAVVITDVRDDEALTEAAADARAVFHLAAQVAVTTSLVHPLKDFDVNLRSTLTILEALRRHNSRAPCIFASTNKVYGNLGDVALQRRGEQYVPEDATLRARGIDESRPLCFHTPYGCSKGAADQYVLDYAHCFGLRTAVLRMSCIYGERQCGTEDQGWLAHFLLRALADDPITIYGDGRQVRDVLYIDDAVDTYVAAWHAIDHIKGRAFNLGGGPANAISLLQLIAHIEQITGRSIELLFEDWRAGDQRYFVADASAVREKLRLGPPLGWREGVSRLAQHFGAPSHAVSLAESA